MQSPTKGDENAQRRLEHGRGAAGDPFVPGDPPRSEPRTEQSRARSPRSPRLHSRIESEFSYDPAIGRFTPKNPLGAAGETLDAVHAAKEKAEKSGIYEKMASGDPDDVFDAAENFGKVFTQLAEGALAPKKILPTYKMLVDDAKPPIPPEQKELAAHVADHPKTWDTLSRRPFHTLKADGPFIFDRPTSTPRSTDQLASLGDPPTTLRLSLVRFRLEGIDTGWRVPRPVAFCPELAMSRPRTGSPNLRGQPYRLELLPPPNQPAPFPGRSRQSPRHTLDPYARHNLRYNDLLFGRLAQLVRALLYTQDVGGSSPSSPTPKRHIATRTCDNSDVATIGWLRSGLRFCPMSLPPDQIPSLPGRGEGSIAIPMCKPSVPTPPSECGFLADNVTDHPPSSRRAKSRSAWQPSSSCCPLAAGLWDKVSRGAPRAHTTPNAACTTYLESLVL